MGVFSNRPADGSNCCLALDSAHKDFTSDQINAFVCDLTAENLEDKIPSSSVDIVTMVFVLSAVAPEKMPSVLQSIRKVLKPHGHVLLRDYALGDLAQQIRICVHMNGKFIAHSVVAMECLECIIKGDRVTIMLWIWICLVQVYGTHGTLRVNRTLSILRVIKSLGLRVLPLLQWLEMKDEALLHLLAVPLHRIDRGMTAGIQVALGASLCKNWKVMLLTRLKRPQRN